MNATTKPAAKKVVEDRLAKKRKTGPAATKDREAFELGAETLADAHAILDALDSGRLKKAPVDDVGKPTRSRLSSADEITLAKLARAGSIDARNRLVAANMGLVHMIARQFRRHGEANYEDIVAAGVFGILRALESYEPDRGLKFSTYAVHWIRAKCQRAREHQRKHDEPVVPIAMKFIASRTNAAQSRKSASCADAVASSRSFVERGVVRVAS